MLKAGDIVVTSAGRGVLGRVLRWGADSPWTHVFLVVSETEAVEAQFLRGVRRFDWRNRLQELERSGRSFVALTRVGIPDSARHDVAQLACSLVGRRYDWLQALLYGLTNSFWNDGPRKLICSRLVTSVFYDLNLSLFPKWHVLRSPGPLYPRRRQLLKGWVTPAEILYYGFVETVAASNERHQRPAA